MWGREYPWKQNLRQVLRREGGGESSTEGQIYMLQTDHTYFLSEE
jgi:hypothetical protein